MGEIRMWKRSELKAKARNVVKKNYWTAIIVCFLVAILTGEFGTSVIEIRQSEDSMDPNYIVNSENIFMTEQVDKEKLQDAQEKTDEVKEKRSQLSSTQQKVLEIVEANLNNITKSQKYMFRIWDAIESFSMKQVILGIEILMMAMISLAFNIIIADPLIVAGKRYFIEAREKENTKIGVIGAIYKKGNWINVGITILLKNIYNSLWYLTIIGGFIKTYEYRMIPYILAENPKIKRKEAFKLSKEMMRGNKWKTFLLDVSFIGWSFVSILTFGLLNILYVNPYKTATMTELYVVLKKKAIEENYEYCESLSNNN